MKNLILLSTLFALLLTSCSYKPKTENQFHNNSVEENIQEDKQTIKNSDISNKTKEYILNGQADKPEAEKLKWSKTFLDEVNIDNVYKEYIDNGGSKDDIESFAKYLTLNAPIPDNWQDLVQVDLLDTYDETISSVKHLENDLYQVYVKIDDDNEVPYVTVNSRTGYFHG